MSIIEANANINLPAESKGIQKLSQALCGILSPVTIFMEGLGERNKISNDEKLLKSIERIDDPVLRMMYQREKYKLTNISKIASLTRQDLQSIPDENISDQPVSIEWLQDFIEYAGKVPDEEIQIIWSKILLGEIKSPKSYSLKTLQILGTVSQIDAEDFSKLCMHLIENTGLLIIDQHVLPEYRVLDFPAIERAMALGLITPISIQRSFTCKFPDNNNLYIGKSQIYFTNSKENILVNDSFSFKLQGYSLSPSGMELSKLVHCPNSPELCMQYQRYFQNKFPQYKITF